MGSNPEYLLKNFLLYFFRNTKFFPGLRVRTIILQKNGMYGNLSMAIAYRKVARVDQSTIQFWNFLPKSQST